MRTDLESVVLGLQSVRVVPGERVSDDEAAQEVVAAEHADNAEREEGQADTVRQEGLVVNPKPRPGVLESDPGDSDEGEGSSQCWVSRENRKNHARANHCALDDRQENLVGPNLVEPLAHRSSQRRNSFVGVLVEEEVKCEEEEGEAQAVVGSTLGDDDVPDVLRDVLVGEPTLGDAVGEDRVGGSDARADDEGFEKLEPREESPDKEGGDQPGTGHDREEEHGQRLPLLAKVGLGKGNAGEKDLQVVETGRSQNAAAQERTQPYLNPNDDANCLEG